MGRGLVLVSRPRGKGELVAERASSNARFDTAGGVVPEEGVTSSKDRLTEDADEGPLALGANELLGASEASRRGAGRGGVSMSL